MGIRRQLSHGLRALIHPLAARRDLTEEIEHYVDQATAANIERGIAPDEARRLAHVQIGNTATLSEQVRRSGWENVVDTALTDVRYAVRRLRSAPGFTTITLLTLALGVGASTAIFSAVRPILFEPLPYPAAERIAMLWEIRGDGGRNDGTFGMYRELAARNRSFESLAVLRSWLPTMTGIDEPERLDGQRVSAAYFEVLGVRPVLGRSFAAADDRAGAPNVVILGDDLWRRRFGGDRAIIGRVITLDHTPHTVIGVMPTGFENVLAPLAGVWAPLKYDIAEGRAWGHHLRTVGRLRPGISLDQATREIGPLAQAVVDELRPETYAPEVQLVAVSLQDDITRGVRPALLAILGAVTLVLVIACVNVTNLLLARGVQRRGEFALRAALGAARGRLVRQLFTEVLLLTTLGGALGVLAAMAGVRALVALSPPELPRLGAIGVDGSAFSFAVAVATLIALMVGIVPALQAARADPQHDLQRDSRRTMGGHRRTRSALVVAEVAIAVVLLVSSGLLLRSLERLFAVPIGFDPERMLTMQIQTAGSRFASDTVSDRFFRHALEAVRRVPGVVTAALTSQLPLSGDRDEYGVRVESNAQGNNTFRYAVSPGYLEAMRIPLRRGRMLDARDVASAPLAAVLSETFARQLFGDADPIGQRIAIGPLAGYSVVGIVGDVRQMSLAVSQPEAVYTTLEQWTFPERAVSLIVRTRGDAGALAPAIRDAVWSIDRDQPVVRIATMDQLVAATAAERRFALILFEAFALAALVLAAAGIYGVLAGRVAERTREIGVRAALGASRASIVGLVLRQGLTLTAIGVSIGLAGTAVATRAIAAMLFGISPADPATYVGVIVLLVTVALLACWVPAARAARVDPASTLRAE